MCGMAPLLARGVLPSLYKSQVLRPGSMHASFFMNRLEKILLVKMSHDSLKVKNIFVSNLSALSIKLDRHWQINTHATIEVQADVGGSQKWSSCYENSCVV